MTGEDGFKAGCDAYAAFFETLSRDQVSKLADLATEDFYFEDPFNKITGRDQVVRMFDRMFDQVKDPHFKILSISWDEAGEVAILKWRFTGDGGRLGPIDFPGLSEVTFNAEGLAASHVDYWDSGTYFYAKLPILKQIIGFIRRKMHA